MSRVTVVIPHWNRADLLISALKHLRLQTHPIQEVLVVDNGSTDGSPEIAENYGATVVRMGRNEGFARAVNQGISECRTEYIAVLNNDVELAPDWLERLTAAFSDDSVWFATGKVLNSSRRDLIDGAFDLLSKGGCSWRAGSQRKDAPVWDEPRTIMFASGTASLFRTDLFRRVGRLDELFGSYLEDVEFGVRCATAGYRGRYVPEAVAFHLGSATLGAWSGEHVRLIARNQALLVARHFPRRWVRQYGWKILVAQGMWGAVALRHGAGWAYVRGKWAGLRLFSRARRHTTDPEQLMAVLDESERTIENLQRQCGPDSYWSLYFKLT